MGAGTAIAWTDNTFNPWWICTKVGPGCDHCYAESLAHRLGYKWGAEAPRRFFGDKHWDDPRRWNKKAEQTGVRVRVFCASMADVFDNAVEQDVRDRLWELVQDTPMLDWQILTKRIGNAQDMLPADWGPRNGYDHVWLGATVVNQEELDRDMGKLFNLWARVRWLSIEPQLGPIDLCAALGMWWNDTMGCYESHGAIFNPFGLDWVVCGGESGHKARPFDLHWARTLRDQCAAAGVPFFMKQMGAKPTTDHRTRPASEPSYITTMITAPGDNPNQWPEDLRVRQFP